MTLKRCDSFPWFLGLLLAFVLATVAHAQAPLTFQYFYDELGQLVKVVDSTGTVIEYVYDEVGNMLEIKRFTVTGLTIFDFNPKQGPSRNDRHHPRTRIQPDSVREHGDV